MRRGQTVTLIRALTLDPPSRFSFDHPKRAASSEDFTLTRAKLRIVDCAGKRSMLYVMSPVLDYDLQGDGEIRHEGLFNPKLTNAIYHRAHISSEVE